jgi:hypothetical protein
MLEILSSAFIVPVVAIAFGCVLGGLGIWKKVREAELAHEREMRIKEMDHAQRMKELELETLRATKLGQ